MDANQKITLPTVNLEQLEQMAIEQALEARAGNRTHAAVDLGISTRTLQRKVAVYHLPPVPPQTGPKTCQASQDLS